MSGHQWSMQLTKGACDVLMERARQIEVEGYARDHDDHHVDGSLSDAAACYLMEAGRGLVSPAAAPKLERFIRWLWPWHDGSWKPKDRRSNLVRGAALALAEIERMDRAAEPQQQKPICVRPATGKYAPPLGWAQWP
jgi:hypothetical protein